MLNPQNPSETWEIVEATCKDCGKRFHTPKDSVLHMGGYCKDCAVARIEKVNQFLIEVSKMQDKEQRERIFKEFFLNLRFYIDNNDFGKFAFTDADVQSEIAALEKELNSERNN